jgi:hypothetical protein
MVLPELLSKRVNKYNIRRKKVTKQRAPALPDSSTFQQLWDALGSRLIESAQGNLLYTQVVRGSSPLPPTIEAGRAFSDYFKGLGVLGENAG